MEKQAVISIRDALLNGGKNTAVITVVFDNGPNLSLAADNVIWNDENEIIIGFVPASSSGSLIANLPIRVLCSTYENIQFISGYTNTKNIGKVVEGLQPLTKLSEENKKKLVDYLIKLNGDNYDLDHKDYYPIDIKRD